MADMTNPRPRRDAAERTAGPGYSAPPSRSSTPRPPAQQQPLGTLKCCCGQTGCIYLKHNCTVLESVEKDVRTAAQLGQSLLERHEAYMADAERDRAELINRIGQLEMDKKELEAENAKTIEQNRALLDQLETLNTTVSDSDTHIKMLEATLQSSQQLIRRLEGAAERAEDMERHLAALEAEQAVLQNSLVTSESEARSAVQRWKRAERGIADLQFQLEKMEKESREEQERHLDVMRRMERQRALEKELNTAAGRLKGAAATKSLQETKGAGSGVVTHFVRDLLQDNATLQLGMAELRDMLMSSNDEIQMLRDQLMFHQPLYDGENNASAASTLRAELLETGLVVPGSPEPDSAISDVADPVSVSPGIPSTPQSSRHQISMSQELHIHHHYHGSKKGETKKPKKKRLGLTPTVFTPPAALTLPSTPVFGTLNSYKQNAFSATPGSSPPRRSRHVSRDSISTAVSGPSNRWSLFSDQPSDFSMSSVPSSPQTDPRNSIFDRTALSDMSLPVSPTTSVDPLSPSWRLGGNMSSLDDSLSCGPPRPPSSDQPQLHEPIMEDDEAASLHEENDAAAGDEAQSDADNLDDVPDFTSNTTGTGEESPPSEATTPTPTQPSPFSTYDELPQDDILSREEEDDATPAPFELPSRHHRPLHRAVSHESIISLHGGLDIHTLKARPSQLTLRPLGTAMADTGLSSITARPVISRAGKDTFRSNSMLRDSLSLGLPAPRSGRIVSSPVASTTAAATMVTTTSASATPPPSAAAASLSSAMLGKFAGWRPWGGGARTPAASTTTTAPPTVTTAATATTAVAVATAPATASAMGATTTVSDNSSTASIAEGPAPPETLHTAEPVPATAAITVPSGSASRETTDINKAAPPSAAVKAMQDLNAQRSPGINQPGVIPGFFEYWAAHQRRGAPSQVHADVIDEEALREGLLGA